MLKFREDDVTVNGVRLHYYRTGGAKPPFVLLHGSSDSGLCWSPVAEWLADRYDVVMPDAQGHGKSARFTSAFKSSDMADQAAGLMQQLGIKKTLVMGHSMGADTAVDLALRYPGLMEGFILEEPIWQIQDVPGQQTPQQLKRHQKMIQAVTGFNQKSETELIEEGRLANPTWSEIDLVEWAHAKKQFDTSLFTNVRERRLSFPEFVPEIDLPTLLITSQWGVVSPEAVQKAAAMWRSRHPFRWVRIMDAGHNIRRDQFAQFKAAVGRFLEAL